MKVKDNFIGKSKMADLARYCVTDFVRSISGRLPSGTVLLDAGAGECAYKELFSHCDYKAIDLAVGDDQWNYGNLDYVAPLDDMPIEDGVFDAVLCTQVLEHLQRPSECVKEMYRVLKPGGTLFLSAPMSQSEHQTPYDFYRYTSFGLRFICEDAGFKEVDIIPMGGMFYRWAYELPRAFELLPSTGFRQGALDLKKLHYLPVKAAFFFFIRIIQIGLLGLDRFDKNSNDPWGWKVIARK